MYYAQINLITDICEATLETSFAIDAPHMIEVESLEDSPLGKKYNRAIKKFWNVQSSRREVILQRLDRIDALTDKPRTRRELALGVAATQTWVQGLDDEAKALRTELGGL